MNNHFLFYFEEGDYMRGRGVCVCLMKGGGGFFFSRVGGERSK